MAKKSAYNSGILSFAFKSLFIVLIMFVFSVMGSKLIKTLNPVCANSISCINNLNPDIENNSPGLFENQTITPPKIELSASDFTKPVLGTETASREKHIYVDLSTQTLSAYEGQALFMQTLVSTGKWYPTPTGDFRIWVKLRATRMTGGTGADYYDLPNVPFVMFFAGGDISQGRGFSLHGAYWHNNFGHPMSHGCVNMRIIDAEKLYNWVNPATAGYTTHSTTSDPGTLITIYGEAPL